MRRLLFWPVLWLFLAACTAQGPARCDANGTLFSDEFTGEVDCGWVLYSDESVVEIQEGALHIRTSQPGSMWWTNPGRNFADVIINADAQPLTGSADNAYGLICRYQSSDNFYIFLISGDGFYAIGKYQTGTEQVTYLTGEGNYLPSEAINQNNQLNHIRASCIGNELTLMVNDVELARVSDPTFVTGDVGLAASTFQAQPLDVQFDNFRVIAP